MNLILKVFLIAVVLIAIIAAATTVLSKVPKQISSAQAIANVTNYIETSYPGAVVNVTSINASQYQGSWSIVASVIINGTRPCPSYFIYSFDYPQYGFVSRLQNNYTSNCVINGIQNGQAYKITSYPIAIVRSYDLRIPQVVNFITKYGYNNVVVTAKYFSSIMLGMQNYSGVWLVNYTTPNSNSTVQVAINQLNGSQAYVSGSVT